MGLTHKSIVGNFAAGAFALSLLGLTACADDTAGTEVVDVEDVHEEADDSEPCNDYYEPAFYDNINEYLGEEVTVFAGVNEVISGSSFVIAGTEDTDVEPLLVVSATEVSGLEPDMTVAVTGVVREAFDLTTVEEDLETDLDDDLYHDWDAEPYIEATKVDTSVASASTE